MNTIQVYIKKQDDYTLTDDTPVSLDGANILDEQLDEARLVLKNSLVELYPPLTEVRIDFLKDGTVIQRDFMLVAEDKTRTFLVGEE